MNRIIYILSFLLFIQTINSQCSPVTNKVLVLGDSWSAFCWQYNVHNVNFNKFGLSDIGAYSSGSSVSTNGPTDLSQSGAEARTYLTAVKKTAIQNALTSNPNIEIVHLSLSGNDFLGSWDTTWTASQVNALSTQIFDSISSIISFLRLQKPSLKIFLSGYDFANFQESINGSTSHPFYSRWAAMLKPRFIQINTMLVNFNAAMKNYALAGTNLFFVDNIGLMQYVYGQTTPLLFPPGGTYLPQSVPFPGGNPNYPSPLVAMNTYITIKDAFHLSEAGFNYFTENQVKNYYFKALRGPDTTIVNENMTCGYVNSVNAFSDTSIIIGNKNNTKHIGLLSFKTPLYNLNQGVGKASIFMKRKSLIGVNPVGTYSLVIGVRAGQIGSSANPDNTDFNATTDFTSTVCHYGTVPSNNSWLRIDIPTSICHQLQSNQLYQFKVSFIGNEANANQALEFYTTSNASNAPFIDLKFTSALSVNAIEKNNSQLFTLFPNPTNTDECSLKFNKSFTGKIQIKNLIGECVYYDIITTLSESHSLILSKLNSGLYIVECSDARTNEIHKNKLIIQTEN